MTKTVAEANEAIKANALIKTVKIVSLASRQKKNTIVKKITSVSTMAVLVIRAGTAVYHTTRTVCSLDALITTRRSPNRFVDITSCIELAKSDPTPGSSPHALQTATIMTTTIYTLPTTLTESLTEPPNGQKTTRAPRQHRSRPGAFS